MKKVLYFGVLTGFALFGCINNNTSNEEPGAKGVARIRLPQLPETFAATGPGNEYSLSVTVTGSGMSPLTQSWKLGEFGGKTESLEGIPAGNDRIFTGILMRGKAVTHKGSYKVDIGGGESVFVPLVLRDVGTGRAEICVEVEGWSGSPDCTPIDTLPVDTFPLTGCWHIQAYEGITLISGTLSFYSDFIYPAGRFTFDGGQTLLAHAAFVNGAWRIDLEPPIYLDDMGGGVVRTDEIKTIHVTNPVPNIEKPFILPPDTSSANRSYHFRIDAFTAGPADEPHGLFFGEMMDASYQKVIGKVTGTATRCGNIIDPMDTVWTDTSVVIDTIGYPDSVIYTLPRPVPMIK